MGIGVGGIQVVETIANPFVDWGEPDVGIWYNTATGEVRIVSKLDYNKDLENQVIWAAGGMAAKMKPPSQPAQPKPKPSILLPGFQPPPNLRGEG